MGWRIGIDTGGTFTDVVAYHAAQKRWLERKVWSQRDDPGASLRAAIESLGVSLGEIDSVVYGTTVVTNALIQGTVAPVALVATKGFRDVLQIARQRRDVSYGMKAPHRQPSPVPRELSFEVDERCDAHGMIQKRVDVHEVEDLLQRIGDSKSVLAVSLLHSYLNAENEQKIAALARKRGKTVSASHEVSPEAREYERTLVTVLNASLLPMMAGFLRALAGVGVEAKRLHLFHSAGGMVQPETAARFPLLLAMSGPAAGVEAASAVARRLELPYAVSFDMGGTTTDCSLIVRGRAEMQMDGSVGPHRVRQPMVAVESIGAGGGSIVRLGEAGLQIGPDSAGADPGPACYKRGGSLPTVTDAAALLGFFGTGEGTGRPISLDLEAAENAYQPLAKKLGLTLEETALGALRVGNAVAARAIKRITMGRGVDARACTLIAFGGAGPMLACQLASELGIRSVIVPFRSSALSALGCLEAKSSFTRQKTVRIRQEHFNTEQFSKVLAELEALVLAELHAGPKLGSDLIVHSALMRYAGQSFEIEIPIPAVPTAQSLTAAFRAKHEETYGYAVDEAWECVAVRTTASSTAIEIQSDTVGTGAGAKALSTTRIYFHDRGWLEANEYRRDSLALTDSVTGPAIVTDEFSTIVVPCDWSAKPRHGGHIYLEHSEAQN